MLPRVSDELASPRPPDRPFIRRYLRAWLFDAKCFTVIVVMRIALSTIGYSRISQRLARPPERSGSHFWAQQIARRVKRLAPLVPHASCLVQALALQYLLGKTGHASQLHIGVRKDEQGKFLAHAWVTCNAKVVLGQHNTKLSEFTRIAELV